MNRCLVVDIETAPDDRLWSSPEFVADIRATLKAPSNYRDPLKIEAAIDEKLDDLRNRAALSWCHGRIRAIGWHELGHDPSQIQAVASEDECEVISRFAAALTGDTLIGGFNCREFDVPFLTMRATVHGIELPRWWPARRDWNRIVDPVDVFGREGRLADYLRAMGLPPKTGDGADAPNMPLEELLEYVRNDVLVESLLIERLQSRIPAMWARTPRDWD